VGTPEGDKQKELLKISYEIGPVGCTRLDQIRNEDIRNELGISPLSEKIK
jgi:hypothetical protein